MTERDAISLTIPAFLRGELSRGDTEKIEALAAKDADFAADIAFQKALAENLKDAPPSDSELEFGWARLSTAIDNEQIKAISGDQKTSANGANDNGSLRLWKYCAALLACIVVGQSLLMSMGRNDGKNDQYVMAGISESGVRMIVTLDDAATTKSLTTFLIRYDAILTSGPNEASQYHIAFSDNQNCSLAHETLRHENELFETYSACRIP